MAEKNPLWLQKLSYQAQDDRTLIETLFTQGAYGAGFPGSTSLQVTQRGSGANMSVDVNYGFCSIQAVNVPSFNGKYLCRSTSVVNLGISANGSGSPRIDTVIAQVYDTDADNNADEDAFVIRVLTGTPTGGATLANRNGATAVPAGAIALADVLVANGASSITNTEIEDRRLPFRLNTAVPYCKVYRSAVQAISSATQTAISFTSENDVYPASNLTLGRQFGMHDASSNPERVYPQLTGLFRVTGGAWWAANSSGTRALAIRKNGNVVAEVRHAPGSATQQCKQNVSIDVVLSTNDYVELTAEQDSGGSQNIGGTTEKECWFQLYAISTL